MNNNKALLPTGVMNMVAQSLLQHWSSEHKSRSSGEIDVAKPAPQIAELLKGILQQHFPAQTPNSQIDSMSLLCSKAVGTSHMSQNWSETVWSVFTSQPMR